MFCWNHLLLTVAPTLVSSVLERPIPHPWHDTLLLTSTVLYCIWLHHSQLIETQILPVFFHRCEMVEREGDLHYYPNTTSLLGLGYSFVLHSLCQIKNKCKINICLIYEEIRGSQTGNEKEKSSQSHTQRPRKKHSIWSYCHYLFNFSMVMHVCNPSTWRQGQFEAMLVNTRRFYLNNTNTRSPCTLS